MRFLWGISTFIETFIITSLKSFAFIWTSCLIPLAHCITI
jgi:hypothetical protein